MMMFFMFMFWGVLIALAVWGFGRLFPQGGGPIRYADSAPDSLEVLAQRYARGEVTREEFLRTREDLRATVE